jgi:uncharacterized protein YkwD
MQEQQHGSDFIDIAVPLIIAVAIIAGAVLFLYNNGTIASIQKGLFNASALSTNITSVTSPYQTTTAAQQQGGSTTGVQPNSTMASIYNYTLSLINSNREAYGLQPVSLSYEISAQQHADSMLQYGYLSHWDTYGMKPYMRYTLVGGRGAVSENVAYVQNESCSALFGCRGNINVRQAIYSMENSMMYNDSICCDNGHRDNILDPNHNQVSIGIAYNSSTVYLVEDFIDNYTEWAGGTPSYSGGNVYLKGTLEDGYRISEVLISYDPPVTNMSVAQLRNTSEYSYGSTIAGVVSNQYSYYNNISTIVASRYVTSGSSFDIEFSMANLTSRYGPGEYTLMLWMNSTSYPAGFIGSTYTIFVNSSGGSYIPDGGRV